ncbi:MAG: hypothetical protein MUC51_08195 [Anaerolineae bacterium]|nr:hypothetical protein [Anaerolineae bacterium]
MTTGTLSDPLADASARFASLPALRAAHAELLQRRRLGEEAPEFAAAVQAFIRQAQATGAVLDDAAERQAAQSLLDFWANHLVRADLESPEATLTEFDPTLAPQIPDDPCPYRGLDAFHSTDRLFFFGRQRLLEQLLDHLRQDHLLAVIGSSGSGKSSLVLAGLVPALQMGALPGSGAWRYLPPLTPGSDPLASLARAVERSASRGPANVATAASRPISLPVDQTAEQFLENPDQLSRLLGDPPGTPAVVVVDQFEEIFTLCRAEPMRQAFVANLLGLLDVPGAGHIVVLTMRTDFVDNVARLPALQERLERAAVRVTPLSAGELREAITGPAAAVGLKFEEGVVDALVHGRLALANSADEFYENLIPEEQITCKRILLRLVRPGEGLEVTSNRIRRQSLYGAGEARDRVDRVLDKLIAARLIRQTAGDTPADAQVEVAHEALVRNWPRLVVWLDEERVRLRARLQLSASAEQWARLNRDPSGLLRGALLEEALKFTDLTELETAFVETSQTDAQRRAQEREAARQRELDQAHALAEEQRLRAEVEAKRAEEQARAISRLRRLMTALIAIFIVAGLILFYAFGQQQQAQQSELGAAAAYATARANAATAAASERSAATQAAEATRAQATAADLRQVAQDALKRSEAAIVSQLATPTASVTPSPTRVPTNTPAPRISPTPYNATPTPRPQPTRTPTSSQVNLTATAAARASLQVELNQIRATQTALAQYALPNR